MHGRVRQVEVAANGRDNGPGGREDSDDGFRRAAGVSRATACAPSGLALLAHLPQNCWGGWSGAGVEARRTGSRWRPTGPLSHGPSPPRSGRKGRIRSRSGGVCASGGRPPLPASPHKLRGGEENSIALRQVCLISRGNARQGFATFIPSPACGEGTSLGERVRAPADAARCSSPMDDLSPTPNLPQQFWGRWASNASPEGAPAPRAQPCRSAPPPALHPTSPGSFGGGGRVVRARRGRREPRPTPAPAAGDPTAPGACARQGAAPPPSATPRGRPRSPARPPGCESQAGTPPAHPPPSSPAR